MGFDLFQRGSSYTLTRQDGLTVSLPQALRTKRYVILFIAGQWWAPCRGVATQLKSFYDAFHQTHDFEVIFLSADKSEGAMLDFFHSAQGDWLCLSYADARSLEAALAGESDLHPKQIPACLVFELEPDATSKSEGRLDTTAAHSARAKATAASAAATTEETSAPHNPPASASDASLVNSALQPTSLARLVTKHGREMLSRDKDGALFPWYDDGWSDAVAQEHSATLRRASAENTPARDAPPPLPSPPSRPQPQPQQVSSPPPPPASSAASPSNARAPKMVDAEIAAAAAAAIVTPAAPAPEEEEEVEVKEGEHETAEETEEDKQKANEREEKESCGEVEGGEAPPTSSTTPVRHGHVVLHTNPRSPPPPPPATAATPSTQLIIKRQPPTVPPAEKDSAAAPHDNSAQREECEESAIGDGDDVNVYEKLHSMATSDATPDSVTEDDTATPTAEATADADVEAAVNEPSVKTGTNVDASPEVAHHQIPAATKENKAVAAAPDSRRQLTYSKSPDHTSGRIKRRPPPPSARVIVVERRLAAAMYPAKVETAKGEGEEGKASAVTNTHRETEKDSAEIESHAVLEAHISAVMEEAASSAASACSDREEADADADADDVQELSVIEKETSALAPAE